MTRALVERPSPIAATLDVESVVERPDILTADHPMVRIHDISLNRSDESGIRIPRSDIFNCVHRPVRAAAVGRDPESQIHIFSQDLAPVVTIENGLAAITTEGRAHLSGSY